MPPEFHWLRHHAANATHGVEVPRDALLGTPVQVAEIDLRTDNPLLLDYLVDEDPQDKTHIVRSEAWLTLWTLTGEMRGIDGRDARRCDCRWRRFWHRNLAAGSRERYAGGR